MPVLSVADHLKDQLTPIEIKYLHEVWQNPTKLFADDESANAHFLYLVNLFNNTAHVLDGAESNPIELLHWTSGKLARYESLATAKKFIRRHEMQDFIQSFRKDFQFELFLNKRKLRRAKPPQDLYYKLRVNILNAIEKTTLNKWENFIVSTSGKKEELIDLSTLKVVPTDPDAQHIWHNPLSISAGIEANTRSMKELLLEDLTEEELDFVNKSWGFSQFEDLDDEDSKNLSRLITLANNQAGALDASETNPADMIYYLNGFQPLNFAQLNYTVDLEDMEVQLWHLREKINQEKQKLMAEKDDSLPSAKATNLKLRLNALKALENKLFLKMSEILKYTQTLQLLADNYHIRFPEIRLSEKYVLPKNKPWIGPFPSRYYFDAERIEEDIQLLSNLPQLDNKEALLQSLVERKKAILPLDIPEIAQLNSLLHSYEVIPKDNLSLRRKRLMEIARLSKALKDQRTLLNKDQSALIENLSEQCEGKARYLQEIPYIWHKAQKRMFRYEHVQGQPLVVDKNEWFGDLDVYHRVFPLELHVRWQNQCDIDPSTPNFWIWMESLEPAELTAMEMDKRYSVPQSEKKVTFQGGLCINARFSNNDKGIIADGIYLYNIDRDNNLYILPTPANFGGKVGWFKELKGQGVKENVSYNHNSVLQGANVKCAGCICFKMGKSFKSIPIAVITNLI